MALLTRILGPASSLGLALGLLAGCSQTLIIDNARLQQNIESGLQDNGITATASCIGEQPIRKGDVFRCQATTTDGTILTIQVTETDDSGTVTWQVIGQ